MNVMLNTDCNKVLTWLMLALLVAFMRSINPPIEIRLGELDARFLQVVREYGILCTFNFTTQHGTCEFGMT